MPSAKRLRRYDPDTVREAFLAQFDHVHDAVRALTPEQLAAPSGLGDWAVRDLAVHLCRALAVVADLLEKPAPPARTLALLDWPFSTAERAEAIDAEIRASAQTVTDLDALYEQAEERAAALLISAPGDRLLATRTGAMPLTDYLVTRTVELVVHTDDLNRALGLDVPLERAALAAAVRLLADALAVRAPGGATEVRIPPFAVVQCVEGPRHTRGTPPNVVETDPVTWLRLATGRTRWADERDAARIHASGERADLSPLLPLMA